MHITVNSQRLATELRLLNKIVPTKPAIAILSHVLLTANDALRFYATDLEIGLTTSCHATIDAPGSVALPVARLLQLVEQFPDNDVRIALESGKVVVTCGVFTSRLQTMPIADFPIAPDVQGVSSTFDAAVVRRLITQTRYAVPTSSSKYILQGALLVMKDQSVAMVATDSKRLALATAHAEAGSDQRLIIPAKTLDILAGQNDDGPLELTVGDKHLFFTTNGRIVTSRTIDGEFPAYARIIPRDNEHVLTVDRNALTAMLRRVLVVAEDNRAIYMTISPDVLELSSVSMLIGSAQEAMPVEYNGPPLKVCVNGEYVRDFLDVASQSTITIALKDANSAMLLTDSDDHLAVIMLMRG